MIFQGTAEWAPANALFRFLLSLEKDKRVFSVRGKPGFCSRAVSVTPGRSHLATRYTCPRLLSPPVPLQGHTLSSMSACRALSQHLEVSERERECFLRPSRTLGTGSQSRGYKICSSGVDRETRAKHADKSILKIAKTSQVW